MHDALPSYRHCVTLNRHRPNYKLQIDVALIQQLREKADLIENP